MALEMSATGFRVSTRDHSTSTARLFTATCRRDSFPDCIAQRFLCGPFIPTRTVSGRIPSIDFLCSFRNRLNEQRRHSHAVELSYPANEFSNRDPKSAATNVVTRFHTSRIGGANSAYPSPVHPDALPPCAIPDSRETSILDLRGQTGCGSCRHQRNQSISSLSIEPNTRSLSSIVQNQRGAADCLGSPQNQAFISVNALL